MVWVMEHAPASLTGTEQSIALVLANFADEAGGNAFPSVSRLAACTHWSERAVQSALRSLTGAGVISIESEATNRQPASYCFPLYRGERAAPLDIVSRGADGASRGAAHDARGARGASRGAAAAPYTSLTVKEPSKNRQGRAGGSAQRRKPETRVDPDFYPEAKLLSWTEQKGWDAPRVAREVEAFIAHHQKLEQRYFATGTPVGGRGSSTACALTRSGQRGCIRMGADQMSAGTGVQPSNPTSPDAKVTQPGEARGDPAHA
jgi:hypothetical protein